MFVYPRPKAAALGEETEAMRRAMPASPQSVEVVNYRKYVPHRNGIETSSFPDLLSSAQEKCATKWEKALRCLPRPKPEVDFAKSEAQEEKGSVIFAECRELIKSLRRRTEASTFTDGAQMTMETLQGNRNDEPLFSLSFEAPVPFSGIWNRRSQEDLPEGSTNKKLLKGITISDSCEARSTDGETSLASVERSNNYPSNPDRDFKISEECSPLQGVFLKTLNGEAVECNTLENNGIFHAKVSGNIDLLQIELVFHSMFQKRIKVSVDGVQISVHNQSVLELKEGGNEFSLEIEYPENNSTLVSDQYLICIQRDSLADGQAPPTKSECEQASVPGLISSTVGDARISDMKAQESLEYDLENIKELERQLEKLEERFTSNLNMLNSHAASHENILEDVASKSESLHRQVKRHITPNSPLVGDIFPDNEEESIFSSQGSSCDAFESGTPSSDSRTRRSGGVGPEKEEEGSQASSLAKAYKSIDSMKQDLQAERARRIASERIQRIESHFIQHTEEVRNDMRSFKFEFEEKADKTRDEMIQRQQDFEVSTDRKLSGFREDINSFSETLFGKIYEEKSLIQEKSKQIEQRLTEKVGNLVSMLGAVQTAVTSSSQNFDKNISDLDNSRKLLHNRLLNAESQFTSLQSELFQLDRKMASVEKMSLGFKESVLADISALEELMHSEKKERQTKDESIIEALNLYTQSMSESLNLERVC